MKTNTELTRSREDEREAEWWREVLRAQMARAFGGTLASLARSQSASAAKPKSGCGRAVRPAG